MTCTFFGHRDAPLEIEGILRQVLIALIEARQADTFYVGNQGKFDRMVARVLSGLQLEYPILLMRWCWHICRGSRNRRRDTTPCIPGV